MKRFISVALALSMLLLLCACGNNGSTDPGTTAAAKVDPSTTAAAGIDRGTTAGERYTNASIAVNFTKPSGWRFYSDEEIAALLNITVEQFKNEEIGAAAKLLTIFEFMAVNDLTGDNVNLAMENLLLSGNAGMTEERYAEVTKQNLQEQLTDASYTFGEDARVSLGGREYLRISAKCIYSGVSMDQFMYLRKAGDYMLVISASGRNGMTASDFEAMFT